MEIKKQLKLSNPFIEYVSFVHEIDNATAFSLATESLKKFVSIIPQYPPSLFDYTGIIYLLVKSLVSIYKNDHMLKQSVKFPFEKFRVILNDVSLIRFGRRYGEGYARMIYQVDHINLLIFNIFLKINTFSGDKYLIQTPGTGNVNTVVDWINLNYKFESLFGLTTYDFAMNMKDYQHYFPYYFQKNVYKLLGKSVIEAWSAIPDRFMSEPSGLPKILETLTVERNQIPDWNKYKNDKLFPSKFLYLISEDPYNFLFNFMLNLFLGESVLFRPVFTFIAIQSEYSENGKTYEFVVTSYGNKKIFGGTTESPPTYENDIHIFEMINFSDDHETKLLLNHYESSNFINPQNKLFATIDSSYILYDENVNSFSVPEGIDYYKCLLEPINWDKINYNLKTLSTILFNYKCKDRIPARVIDRFRDVITEYETEYASVFAKEILNAKVIYILITGDVDHEYMRFIFQETNLFLIPIYLYRKFFELIYSKIDKVVSITNLWISVQTDQYSYFIRLFKKVVPVGSVSDELFGDLDLYDVVAEAGYRIALIPSHYFKNFTYYSPGEDQLVKQYIFYRDQATKRIYGITNKKHLSNIEVLITKSGGFSVLKKGTDYKYVRSITGLAKHFYDKLYAPSSHNMLISHNDNEILINVIGHATFKIQGGKIFYENYELITDKYNFAQNQFIYDLPTAFLLKKDLDHKILLIACNECAEKIYPMDNLVKSVWINSSTTIEIMTETTPGYKLIDLHYTNCYPIFSDYSTMATYLIFCGIMGKTFCMLSIFNQYLQDTLNQTHWDPKMLNFCLNNPYKYYFLLMATQYLQKAGNFDLLPDEEPYIPLHEYTKRLAYYPPRYKIAAHNKYPPINYQFKYSEFIQNLTNKMISISDKPIKDIPMDRLIAIDPTYGRYIETFRESYRSCSLKKYPSGIETLIIDLRRKIIKTQNKIAKIVSESIDTIPTTIYSNYELFYDHLEQIKSYQILVGIHRLCSTELRPNCECNEIKKFQDLLNAAVIYTGAREINVVFYEILFGSFIRTDQYQIYWQMTNGVTQKNKYSIYQMLMGEGKTSVIAPLLVIKYLYDNAYDNIILVMPEHLKQQSFNLLLYRYGLILERGAIRLTEIERRGTNLERFIKKSDVTNIIIIDDTSYKAILLNAVESNEMGTIAMGHIRDNSICIMDEIDTMMDPLSSDLNYPLGHREVDSFVVYFMVYALNDMLRRNEYRELVFVTGRESRIFVDGWFTIAAGSYEGVGKEELRYFVMGYMEGRELILPNINYKIVGQMRKIYGTLKDCLVMVHNKDYGFGNKIPKYEKNNFVAIPYRAVGDPVDRSEFTGPEITLCLSILTYHYEQLRVTDLEKLQVFVRSIFKKYGAAYIYIPVNKQLMKILERHGSDLQKIADANEQELARIKFNGDRDLINYYIMHVISQQFIDITKNQFNCSFIDVISGTFIKHKIAFSGTVNILLPSTLIEKYEFKTINHSDKANGSAISALIGYVNTNNIIHLDETTDILGKIISIVVRDNYNVLIDIGAFLRKIGPLNFVKLLAGANEVYQRKKYIYIDHQGIKHVYYSGEQFLLGENAYPTEDVFIYYDNMHIVGIDVKQPYNLKALATVDHFNRLTTVEQGIFRLRNINFGHKIDFLLSNNIPRGHIKDPIDLLGYLTEKENQYIQASIPAFWMQNIKYLSRQSGEPNQKSYIDNVYYEVIRTKEDLDLPLYKKYVKDEYCNYRVKLMKIRVLCENLLKVVVEPVRNSQKQKEVAEEKIVAKEVIVGRSKIDYGRIAAFKLAVTSAKYTIEDYISISDGIKKLDIPGIFDYLKMRNVYLSPDFLNYIRSRPDIYGALYDKVDDIYVELVKNYNFYYIKKLGKQVEYLLVSPAEFFNLFIFLVRNRYGGDIVVKHKLGGVKYPLLGDDKPDETELLIKFVLSNRLMLGEYTKLFEQVIAEGSYDAFDDLVDSMVKIYLFRSENKRYIDYFIGERDKFSAGVKKFCDPVNIGELLNILRINLPVESLSERDKEDIIKNSGIITCSSGGGNRRFLKYRFWT
ncbi:MAG: hypothetical protein Hyperionvirus22_6 [Hyperionvirus sp.]|uniref:DUF3638 domain-containing protein n=1 Tax=Hyperionvirus sp. TaxID=2487770 RepID=A0A3G5AAN1_9VIRU|nr:MAG: hypothetical protein Hyperionvirus22_6 [Hyperionvirus sp.]